jgi:hypothetical protein
MCVAKRCGAGDYTGRCIAVVACQNVLTRARTSVQFVEAREQPEENVSDVTGFHEGGGCQEGPEGESQQPERGEEEGGESMVLAALGDHFEGGGVDQSRIEDGSGSDRGSTIIHGMTPYVASCAAHVESLRKRKREQEERVEALVQGTDGSSHEEGRVWRTNSFLLLTESFEHVEAIMNFLVASLQQSHASSRAEFDAVDARIAQSLDKHNRVRRTASRQSEALEVTPSSMNRSRRR